MKTLIHGVQANGTPTPCLVDSDGKLQLIVTYQDAIVPVALEDIASHSANYYSPSIYNTVYKGAMVTLRVTSNPSTRALTLYMTFGTSLDTSTYTRVACSSFSSTGIVNMLIYPGAVVTGSSVNQVAGVALPYLFHIGVNISPVGAVTFGIEILYILL